MDGRINELMYEFAICFNNQQHDDGAVHEYTITHQLQQPATILSQTAKITDSF